MQPELISRINFVQNPPVKICEWQQVLYHRTEAKKGGFYENIGFGNETSGKKPRFWDILRTYPYFQLVTSNSQLLTEALPITELIKVGADIAIAPDG